MKRGVNSQIIVLMAAVVLYLYFWKGGIAVAICCIPIAILFTIRAVHRRRNRRQEPKIEAAQRVEVKVDVEAITIARRREQGETLRQFIVQAENREPKLSRVTKRLSDWYLEYLRTDTIYHRDLYDFILDKCKERLTTAEANYLKSELRLTIEVVRSFMRGQKLSEVLDDITNWDVELVVDGVSHKMQRVNYNLADMCSTAFFFNEKGKNTTTWNKGLKHYWFIKAPCGDPAQEKNWEVRATHNVAVSGEKNTYSANGFTTSYGGF